MTYRQTKVIKSALTPKQPFPPSAGNTAMEGTDNSGKEDTGRLFKVSLGISDAYFALGLRSGLQRFFDSQNIRVHFFNRINTNLRMDMMFLSASLRLPLTLCSLVARPRWVFMFKNQLDAEVSPAFSGCCEDAVLFYHQHIDDVISQVKQAMSSPPRPHCRRTVEPLTSREWQILDYFTRGVVNHQIARRLHLSEKTVSGHKIQAMKKLNITHNVALHRWCQENIHLFTSTTG